MGCDKTIHKSVVARNVDAVKEYVIKNRNVTYSVVVATIIDAVSK